MKEKPIIFTETIEAVLDSKKTQTRRIINPQPQYVHNTWYYNGEFYISDDSMRDHLFHNVYGEHGTPYGSVYGDGTGDHLWVKEKWSVGKHYNATKPSELPKDIQVWWSTGDKRYDVQDDYWQQGKWRPSIYMPRWASRITLEIVDVRVERVQKISEADAQAEGCDGEQVYLGDGNINVITPREQFAKLWDFINAKRGYSWESNPWVWVIEFKKL